MPQTQTETLTPAYLYVGTVGRPADYETAGNEYPAKLSALAAQINADAGLLTKLVANGWKLELDSLEDERIIYRAVKNFSNVDAAIEEARALGATGRTLDWDPRGENFQDHVID